MKLLHFTEACEITPVLKLLHFTDIHIQTLNEHRQYVKLLHFTEAMVFGESWNPLRHEGPGMRFQFVILPSDKKNAKDGGA